MEITKLMKMTTPKLIVLRLIMTTAGRWAWFGKAFKKFMVWYTVSSRGEEKYVASSRYFSIDMLEEDHCKIRKTVHKK